MFECSITKLNTFKCEKPVNLTMNIIRFKNSVFETYLILHRSLHLMIVRSVAIHRSSFQVHINKIFTQVLQ